MCPKLCGAEIAAVYHDLRRAGDFYEFLRVGRWRMVLALLDVAGRRAHTREILRAAHSIFRKSVLWHFAADDGNEAIAMMELRQTLNQTILEERDPGLPWFSRLLQRTVGDGLRCQRRASSGLAVPWSSDDATGSDRPAAGIVFASSAGRVHLRAAEEFSRPRLTHNHVTRWLWFVTRGRGEVTRVRWGKCHS